MENSKTITFEEAKTIIPIGISALYNLERGSFDTKQETWDTIKNDYVYSVDEIGRVWAEGPAVVFIDGKWVDSQ